MSKHPISWFDVGQFALRAVSVTAFLMLAVGATVSFYVGAVAYGLFSLLMLVGSLWIVDHVRATGERYLLRSQVEDLRARAQIGREHRAQLQRHIRELHDERVQR